MADKFGFLYPITNVLAEKYTRGLYQLDQETQLYVNTGLGRPPFMPVLG